MKLVKLSIVALTFGMFVTSCGNGGEAKKDGVDSPKATTEAPKTETPAAPKVDTPVAGAAKADTPAKKEDAKMDAKKDGKMEAKKDDKKMEAKKK